MTDPTPIPADDADERRVEDGAADEREVDELAPEEELLGGWLPVAEPTDGPAPAP